MTSVWKSGTVETVGCSKKKKDGLNIEKQVLKVCDAKWGKAQNKKKREKERQRGKTEREEVKND